MLEEYSRQFGVANSHILFPGQAANYGEVPQSYADKVSLTFAYVGSLHTGGIMDDLINFAHALDKENHVLKLYGSTSLQELKKRGLITNNVVKENWIESNDLIPHIQRSVDVLILLQDSATEQKYSVALNFPSKIVDYMQCGLPIIVLGPAYSSGQKFIKSFPSAFISITNIATCTSAKLNTFKSGTFRKELAKAAASIGTSYFSDAIIKDKFYKILIG